MKRSYLALGAALCVGLGVAGAASAADIEVGVTATQLVAPVCPADAQGSKCTIVLAQMTAYETASDGRVNPTTIKHAGLLSAFSVGVSSISTNKKTQASYIKGLDQAYGGSPRVRLTVLRTIGRNGAQHLQVAAQSPSFSLTHYLGKVVEFPLTRPIAVTRGEVLALTTRTWAPVLSIELAPSKFGYRQSRNYSCTSTVAKNFAQLRIGAYTTYGCAYSGTRIEYSATEVTSPSPTS